MKAKRHIKGSNRLNGPRIKRLPLVEDASKKQCESIQHMKNQRLSDEEIAILTKRLNHWKKTHRKTECENK